MQKRGPDGRFISSEAPINRFWSKVNKGKDDKCWEWQAGKTSGYGSFWYKGRHILAHRFSWQLVNGPIPNEMDVLHHCDNRRCVNPDHLFLGTDADNVADMVAKGRHVPPIGERCGNSKLTKEQVFNIRYRYETEDITQKELAEDAPVGQTQIGNIVHRRCWTHI